MSKFLCKSLARVIRSQLTERQNVCNVRTRMGFCRSRFWMPDMRKGRMTLVSRLVPRGVMPLNWTCVCQQKRLISSMAISTKQNLRVSRLVPRGVMPATHMIQHIRQELRQLSTEAQTSRLPSVHIAAQGGHAIEKYNL